MLIFCPVTRNDASLNYVHTFSSRLFTFVKYYTISLQCRQGRFLQKGSFCIIRKRNNSESITSGPVPNFLRASATSKTSYESFGKEFKSGIKPLLHWISFLNIIALQYTCLCSQMNLTYTPNVWSNLLLAHVTLKILYTTFVSNEMENALTSQMLLVTL
jgi:hypothetical protein